LIGCLRHTGRRCFVLQDTDGERGYRSGHGKCQTWLRAPIDDACRYVPEQIHDAWLGNSRRQTHRFFEQRQQAWPDARERLCRGEQWCQHAGSHDKWYADPISGAVGAGGWCVAAHPLRAASRALYHAIDKQRWRRGLAASRRAAEYPKPARETACQGKISTCAGAGPLIAPRIAAPRKWTGSWGAMPTPSCRSWKGKTSNSSSGC